MAQSQILKDLKACMRKAGGVPAKMTVCENAFTNAGGTTTQDGGKVFTPPAGEGEAFVTNGGKVFG